MPRPGPAQPNNTSHQLPRPLLETQSQIHSQQSPPPPPAMSVFPSATLLRLSISLAISLAAHFLHLPSLLLHGLHTYIHPDSLPSSTPRAVLHPPSQNPTSKRTHRNNTNTISSAFDSTATSQLFRLRLSHSHLSSRPHFSLYHLSLLLSISTFFASFAAVAVSFLLLALLLTPPASRRADRSVSFLAALLAAAATFRSFPSNLLAGFLSGLTFLPAARFARAFWLGTDQLRSGLSPLASSAASSLLLYLSVLGPAASSLLLILFPVSDRIRVASLAAAAAFQMVALRAAVQAYLDEAVFCWYQRLHAGKVADVDYGRAKVFLHNHHLCTVATQLVAVPMLVLLLLGISRTEGSSLFGWSDAAKETALLAASWIMLSWSVSVVAVLVCYRRGWLFVS